MEEITVKELAEMAAKLVNAGYGNKKILITNDDECNGLHVLYQLFSAYSKDCYIELPFGMSQEEAIGDYLILG